MPDTAKAMPLMQRISALFKQDFGFLFAPSRYPFERRQLLRLLFYLALLLFAVRLFFPSEPPLSHQTAPKPSAKMDGQAIIEEAPVSKGIDEMQKNRRLDQPIQPEPPKEPAIEKDLPPVVPNILEEDTEEKILPEPVL